jgi:hypothetical protein
MKLFISLIEKYLGVVFFGLLYILNLLTSFSPESNRFLIFMTIICLVYPTIQKQNPWN